MSEVHGRAYPLPFEGVPAPADNCGTTTELDPAVKASWSTLLQPLYAPRTAAGLAERLDPLLGAWRPRLRLPAQGGHSPRLTERDILLIAYPDQVQEPGVPPLRSLDDFCRHHLQSLVSGVHLLPFYPSSSDDGFSVKDYLAVDPAYGTWEDLARLGERFDLMFDAVLNHVSAESEWFERFRSGDEQFRDFFITVAGNPDLSQVVRPRALPLLTEFVTARGPERVWTTFSADQVDLNYRCPAVLLAVLGALLGYAARGARFLRLDAVAFLWKEIGTPCLHRPETHRLIQLFRAVLADVAPRVRLVTETNVPHADNVAYFGDGTNEAHLVYNFALPPLVLHSLATGDARQLTDWAEALVWPSTEATFLNFLASHDGIGLNPVRGLLPAEAIQALVDRTRRHGGDISFKHQPDGSRSPYELNINFLDALCDPAGQEPVDGVARRFLTAQSILLCLRGVPAIYFHSLFGSRGDRAGAERSGIARRINREKVDRLRLERELSNPGSLRARVFAGCRALLKARRAHPAFSPDAAQSVCRMDPGVFAVRRESPGGRDVVLCVHNLSPHAIRVRLPSPPHPDASWLNIGGAGSSVVSGGDLWLEAQSAIWLAARVGAEGQSGGRGFAAADPTPWQST